ncbi:MAG: putative molybdenum carrier protein [Verrucomicrobiota bacterium]
MLACLLTRGRPRRWGCAASTEFENDFRWRRHWTPLCISALPFTTGLGWTGADRAALDWAIEKGIPHGGWFQGQF